MPITPLDIKNKTFSSQLRGLAPREVRSFLELVAKEVEELRRERGMLAEKVDELAARLETYERTEALLKETLITAQKATNELRTNAEERSRMIVERAEQRAREIILEGEKEAAKLKADLKEFETRRLNLIDQIRGLAHACLAMADTWEKKPENKSGQAAGGGER